VKKLRQISIIGLGLLGSSVSLAVLRAFGGVKTVGYSHRSVTRQKARHLAVASEIVDDLRESVGAADVVILATPISTFEQIFMEIRDALADECIVTDVGSTKVLPHRWDGQAPAEKSALYWFSSYRRFGTERRGVRQG